MASNLRHKTSPSCPYSVPRHFPVFVDHTVDRSITRAHHDLRPVPFDIVDRVHVTTQGHPGQHHTCPAVLDLLERAVHHHPIEREAWDRVDRVATGQG